MSNAIEVRGVSKSFGEVRAVDGIDFSIPEGSLCGFLGPNGAGKSTTIRMIMSIIYPDAGSIIVKGGSALDQKDLIGYLPEERGLYRKMRVGEFIRYIAKLKGVEAGGLSNRIDDWLERMDLPGVRRRRCQELSKGMQQKVQFIASVIHEPELVILDEPFSGLDPVNARLLGDAIREIHESGRTIIFSTHVLHQAEKLCDRVLMINKGHIVLDDALDSIRRRFDPRTIRLEPTGDPRSVLERATAHPTVTSATIVDDGSAVEIHMGGDVESSRGIPSDLLGVLVDDSPLRSVALRKPTLDDVFVELVGATVAKVEEETA